MIILPLVVPETSWSGLEPLMSRQWRAEDFSNTSPYHIHESSPVPLGSESTLPACRGYCHQGRKPCEHPKHCQSAQSDFEDSVIRAEARARATRRADAAMELLAWVIAAAILGALSLAAWGIVASWFA